MTKNYSLFIGRYQPLHKGHIELIRVVLKEGKNVCVALRNTLTSNENPYSIRARKKMFRKHFRNELAEEQMKIITIPDIEEVCYGRKVGWRIRKIELPEQIESISATKIRDNLNHR